MVLETTTSSDDDNESQKGENEQTSSSAEDFRLLVFSIASCRPDILISKKRKELMDTALQVLQSSPDCRRILSEWKDLKCSSNYAYRRVAELITNGIIYESQTDKISSVQQDLLSNLSLLLCQSQDANILESACQSLVRAFADNEPTRTAMASFLYNVADEATNNTDGRAIPAIALGFALETDGATKDATTDWIGLLLKTSIALFASPQSLGLARSVMTVSPKQWSETVSPQLQLKLKSHPDKALSTVSAWIQHCVSNNPNSGAAMDIDHEWLQLLVSKHLIASPKDENRALASDILVAWSNYSATSLSSVVDSLAKAKVTLAPARVNVYDTYERMAAVRQQESAVVASSATVSCALEGLVSLLNKETKADQRDLGQQALVEWLIVAKKQQSLGSEDKQKGYDTAMGYIQSPVIDKKTQEVGPILSQLVQRVHPDLLERIVVDLWNSNANAKKLQSGLEGLVTVAQNKKAVHLEGLLAVYLTLVYTGASDEGKVTLPTYCSDVLSAGSSPVNNESSTKGGTPFIFSSAMLDLLASNTVASLVLSRCLSLYTQLAAKRSKEALPSLFSSGGKKVTLAARAMAVCAMYPSSMTGAISRQDQYATLALLSSLEMILTYQPKAAEGIATALFCQVNDLTSKFERMAVEATATREAREAERPPLSTREYDPCAVRRVSRVLSRHCGGSVQVVARCMVLMHVGSSLRSDGHQRAALILNTLGLIEDVLLPMEKQDQSVRFTISEEITSITTVGTNVDLEDQKSGEGIIDDDGSFALHEAGLSLITSLGGIACNFSPSSDDPEDEDMKRYVFASKMCIENLGSALSSRLNSVLEKVESLSEFDVSVYLSPTGTLFKEQAMNSSGEKKSGGKRLSEDEEWELQMKRELEAKKASGNGAILSPEEQKLVTEQDNLRSRVSRLLHRNFSRCLSAIRYLCSSDIEVGNESLPTVTNSVLTAATSKCPALRRIDTLGIESLQALSALAACVYEIDETHAPTIALALAISCRQTESTSKDAAARLSPSELPSPCPSAACVIYEMDQVHDCLSGPSFIFLFPIVRASLMGPRTPPGCEASLRILSRHTDLLAGDRFDKRVTDLRKDMVISVLDLLKHDRAQSFHDPTPFETLISCYKVSDPDAAAFATAELAPLLDERGAIGAKSCRVGSMLVLEAIGRSSGSPIRKNPLVENRVWLNCFDEHEEIRLCARKTWLILHGAGSIAENDELPPPSPLYAASLLPLFSHKDESISKAASVAFANAMAKHPSSVARNIETLSKGYIDAYPTDLDEIEKAGGGVSGVPLVAAKKPTALPSKKPSVASGLKKKPAAKKSPLAIAGIGKPKSGIKKKAVSSALLKPKTERTLDQASLESQFTGGGTKKVDENKDSPAKVTTRLGMLRAIAALSDSSLKVCLDEATLKLLTSFLMAYGIAEKDETLKAAARNALRDVIAVNGGTDESISFLLPHLEVVLKTGVSDEKSLGSLPVEKVPRSVAASDRRKEGAVVALGSVALHLKGPENEERIDNTIDMLLNALKTPSEDVQSSVADALSKLMKKGRTQTRIESILNGLVQDCLNGESLAVQRGSAYGISAAVKGSGIATLKKFEIVTQLENACASGSSKSKEGSLFAIELLCDRLGLLFEPYVISLLPSLLKSFSDNSDHVRTAAATTVGMIMSKLSAHGVKLVMPAVLTAFNDPAWRTKQASIHMLGAMSHLAPKQLASALPKVVPKLTEAFSDTHPKVKASAHEALTEISTVIRNPEIKSISSTLLKALTDPADHTIKALETLIATEFLHAIDAPSLALIVPLLHRGLRDRGATTKRYSGLIAGNITTMINDPKDFVPYIPTLLPDLQTCLLDPIPDVRSTSAKALGSLTRSLKEQILPDLRPWLIKKLRENGCSSAERSGAAQGLTEVLIASGSHVVDEAMRNEILPLRSHPEPSTREGVLWMLTFLPPIMGQGFTPLIDVSLPALIAGLSDDSEPVRDVALRAGRVLIRSHGRIHVDKILPSLEEALRNPDYRIRVASLSLLGDLLTMIGGTTLVKGEGDTQDDIRKAERAQAQIALVLGSDTRKRVLSSLYLCRSDSVHAVRQSALQVWKTVVSVTGRTLRDILPVLVSKIVDDLASGDEDKTVVAGRCLGDVVSKLGESVLPQIIPVLRKALAEGDEHTRRGVCVGLTEVISCSTKDQVLRFIEIIVRAVQDALSDDSASVREMAASSFKSLHSVVGSRAMDEVVPSLMVALESRDGDEITRVRALNGLTGILSVRSRELLPYIVPRLIQRPITQSHAKALSGVAAVTGGTLYNHFAAIVPSLLADMAESDDDDERVLSVRDCARSICKSADTAGINILASEIAAKCGNDKAGLRRESCRMFELLIVERAERQDFFEQIPIMFRELLYRLNDDNVSVLKATNSALAALSKHVPAEELVKHVEFIRNLIASMVSDARRRKGGVGDGEFLLPGFNMPKGLEPFIPIFQRGILYGSPTIREVSATGLGELIGLTSNKFLAGPLIIKMTGPLLRIVGDRNPANVKVAILKTLGLILVKGGPALRAFVPQFQTTFVKALSDPSRQVRTEAIGALSLLMPLSTRVDPLIKELVTGSLGKNLSSVEGLAAAAIQTATLEALAVVLDKGGTKAKLPVSVPSALDASRELLRSQDDGIRASAAKVMGEACALSSMDVTLETLREDILSDDKGDASSARHGKACAVHRILASARESVDTGTLEDLTKLSLQYLADDKDSVREAACAALGACIGRSADPKASFKFHESELLKVLNNSRESMDMHRAMARGICVALTMIDGDKRLDCMGVTLVDACLKLALSGAQRVQFSYNDVLWLVLNVESGNDGLEQYANTAVFENVRTMKSLHSKVLSRMTEVKIN